MAKRDLSPDVRKDPTRALPLIEKYQRSIEKYCEDYLDKVRDEISKKFDIKVNEVGDISSLLIPFLDSLGIAYFDEFGTALAISNTMSAYKHGITFAAAAMKSAGVKDVSKKMMTEDWRALDWLDTRNLSVLSGITEEMNAAIVREISEGMVLGESVSQIADRLTGIKGLTEARAYRIAHYETMFASNQGTIIRYYQNGISKVEWIACGDDHVCPECDDLDGKVFDIDNVPNCPLHIGCRCTFAPVVGRPYEAEFTFRLKMRGYDTFMDYVHNQIFTVQPGVAHA